MPSPASLVNVAKRVSQRLLLSCLKMDIIVNTRMPELEFSWEGTDENDPVCGRGKIEFPTPFDGEGIIYIHNRGSSIFTIKRMEQAAPDNVVKLR